MRETRVRDTTNIAYTEVNPVLAVVLTHSLTGRLESNQ